MNTTTLCFHLRLGVRTLTAILSKGPTFEIVFSSGFTKWLSPFWLKHARHDLHFWRTSPAMPSHQCLFEKMLNRLFVAKRPKNRPLRAMERRACYSDSGAVTLTPYSRRTSTFAKHSINVMFN